MMLSSLDTESLKHLRPKLNIIHHLKMDVGRVCSLTPLTFIDSQNYELAVVLILAEMSC